MRRTNLNLMDRRRIEELYIEGRPVSEIAQIIGSDKSGIYRELRRGRTGKADRNGRPEYSAEAAQEKSYWNKERVEQEV